MRAPQGPRREVRRILHQGVACWVTCDGDALVRRDGRRVREVEAIRLAPCEPGKILCLHLNYESRRAEFQAPADVWEHLAGFAPANDVGCQDFRDTDAGSMLRVKGQDGFCPIGPGLVSGVDARESVLPTYLNGKVVQEGKIAEMVFGIDTLLANLCRHITLLPGDVVLTGTPANSRPMQPGDVVEVEVSGLGRLVIRVAEIPAPLHAIGHQPTDSPAVRAVALGSNFGIARRRR
jgi:5-oxopent-3-ene-1,2,5-tricarboxylate decarboxylase/2-hydroxyhepta-2,4-diene-1,7-dioate isomerase